MCGFVGHYHPESLPAKEQVRAATDTIHHRGPDDEGHYDDDHVAFGFRRLSILDLSPTGHQPMTDATQKLWIVFNGEIYNFIELKKELTARGERFQSSSDTEVILAAYRTWGVHCFERMNGMWAMALWDSEKKELILSRDRFGEKPLYYTRHEGGVVFGSEIKALLAVTKRVPPPNEQSIFDYLAFAFHDHTDQTFFSGIQQLSPGHYAVLKGGTVTVSPYWTLQPAIDVPQNFAAAAECFAELFFDSVCLRLRSDVPVGSCLSGGLDSSSIVLAMRQLLDAQGAPTAIQTFTAASDNPVYDERRYSTEVNRLANAEGNTVFPHPEVFRQEFKKLLWHQEEPFLSMSMFAQWEVMKRAHAKGLKVLLDGQGGDEILAGYMPFFASLLANELRHGRIPGFIRQARAVARYHRRSLMDILPTFALYALPQPVGKWLLRRAGNQDILLLEPAFRKKFFRAPVLPTPFVSRLKNHMYRLLTGTGVRALLHYEDRNAMAFSVESRVPFLDHRLAELTMAVPDSFLLDGGETKRLLRAGLKKLLPASILTRREKMGFVVPQKEWMRTALRNDLLTALRSDKNHLGQYISGTIMQNVLDRFLSGDDRLYGTVWRWYNLETWIQTFYE